MRAVHDLVKPNRQVAQTYRDRLLLRDELDRVDGAGAFNARLLLHLDSVVDADHLGVRLEQDHLVDLLEVVDLFDLPIVRLSVDDFRGLLVEHVDLGGVFRVILDLVLDQV